MVLHDVQILAAIAMHKGMIIKALPGEGKTFVGALTAYLRALAGKGVHMVVIFASYAPLRSV